MKQSELTALWVTIIAVLALAVPLAAAPPRYICQDLSAPPDYTVSFANALNITGQVVGLGGFYADPLLVHRAFLKNYGQPMVDLGTLGGSESWAYAINNLGQVVGSAGYGPQPGQVHAFLTKAGQPMVDLGTLAGGSGASPRIIQCHMPFSGIRE